MFVERLFRGHPVSWADVGSHMTLSRAEALDYVSGRPVELARAALYDVVFACQPALLAGLQTAAECPDESVILTMAVWAGSCARRWSAASAEDTYRVVVTRSASYPRLSTVRLTPRTVGRRATLYVDGVPLRLERGFDERGRARVRARDLAGVRHGRATLGLGVDGSDAACRRADETLLTSAVDRVRKQVASETGQAARDKIESLVGALGERVGTGYAWLFTPDTRQRKLVSIVWDKGWQKVRLDCDQPSVTAHVMRTGQHFHCDDVTRIDFFHEAVPNIRSALSLPVRASGRSEILGVLHFESEKLAAYSKVDVLDLQAATHELVPHLLLLGWLRDGGRRRLAWSPYRYKWDLEVILQRWVAAMTNAVDAGDGLSPRFTLYYADWAKRRLFVLATTRHGFEREWDRPLGFDSVAGHAAGTRAGTVDSVVPTDDPRYAYPETARRLGIRRVLVVPVYTDGDPANQASCVLTTYLFRDDGPNRRISNPFLVDLARQLGDAVSTYVRQRRQLATAYVQFQLSKSHAQHHTLVELVAECLQGGGCTSFAHDPYAARVVAVASTGLEVGYAPPIYRLDASLSEGFTTFLARHPGTCVRKHNVQDPDEPGLPDGFPRRPTTVSREAGAVSETEHRRFMAVSIETGSGSGDLLGVIRVLRPSTAKPFTHWDEQVLADLAALGRPLFMDYRAAASTATVTRRAGDRSVPALPDVTTRNLLQIKERIKQILQELVSRPPDNDPWGWEAKFYVYDMSGENCTPDLRLYESHSAEPWPYRGGTVADELIGDSIVNRAIYTADAADPAVAGQAGANARAIVPVFAWTGAGLVKAVLVLGGRHRHAWRAIDVAAVHTASLDLSVALAATGGLKLNPDVVRCTTADAVSRFLRFAAEETGADWTRVVSRRNATDVVPPYGDQPASTDGSWVPFNPNRPSSGIEGQRQHESDHDARNYDVKFKRHDSAWTFPLHVGPFAIADLYGGPDVRQLREEPALVLSRICGIWATLLKHMPSLWPATYTSTAVGAADAGWTRWDAELNCTVDSRGVLPQSVGSAGPASVSAYDLPPADFTYGTPG